MKYERLTMRNGAGEAVSVLCKNCHIQDKCDFSKETCCDELADRLAELEDKIESGKLVELPCKLGENFVIQDYGFNRFRVEERRIVGYNFSQFDSTICPVDEYKKPYFPDRVFSTKEQAEARLKELQNEE